MTIVSKDVPYEVPLQISISGDEYATIAPFLKLIPE
jgi:hypothetical protein